MPYLLPNSGFDQTLDEIEQLLSPFGDVSVQRDGTTDTRISFLVSAPGYGQPQEAVFEYREWYHLTSQGWLRVRYKFEYRPTDSRKAYHNGHQGHWGPHQHCEPRGRRSGNHYADYERLLQPTIEELGLLYARHEQIECIGLRRLDKRHVRIDEEIDDDTQTSGALAVSAGAPSF